METKASYDPALITLAAEQVADLWAEQIQKPLNKDNGDDNPMLFMLASLTTMKAQEGIDPQRLVWFKASIVRQIQNQFRAEPPPHYVRLSADYGPDQILQTACVDAGIDADCVPWKSHTTVYFDRNVIDWRFGYTGAYLSKPIE